MRSIHVAMCVALALIAVIVAMAIRDEPTQRIDEPTHHEVSSVSPATTPVAERPAEPANRTSAPDAMPAVGVPPSRIRVEGCVVRFDGEQPIAGIALVATDPRDQTFRATSGTDGGYSIEVPSAVRRLAFALADDAVGPNGRPYRICQDTDIVLDDDARNEARVKHDVFVQETKAVIRVRCRQPNGQPVDGADVRLTCIKRVQDGWATRGSRRAQCGSNGLATFAYWATVADDERVIAHATAASGGCALSRLTTQADLTARADTIELELVEGGAITVIVEDASGTSIARARIRAALSVDGVEVAEHLIAADDSGTARLMDLVSGTWSVEAIDIASNVARQTQDVQVLAGVTVETRFVLPARLPHFVRGRLVDTLQRPVAGINVRIEAMEGAMVVENRWANSDDDGIFEARFANCDQARVHPTTLLEGRWSPRDLTVRADDELSTFVFDRAATRWIFVRAVDATTGDRLDGCMTWVWPEFEESTDQAMINSGNNGSYASTAVSIDERIFGAVVAFGYRPQRFAIEPGTDDVVRVVRLESGAAAHLFVVDGNTDQPIAGATALFGDTVRGVTNDAGRLDVEDLPAESTLRITAPGHFDGSWSSHSSTGWLDYVWLERQP